MTPYTEASTLKPVHSEVQFALVIKSQSYPDKVTVVSPQGVAVRRAYDTLSEIPTHHRFDSVWHADSLRKVEIHGLKEGIATITALIGEERAEYEVMEKESLIERLESAMIVAVC